MLGGVSLGQSPDPARLIRRPIQRCVRKPDALRWTLHRILPGATGKRY
ncbi:hypothetical protein PAMC26510_02535 [Caballeronia sordidicola]|uniref:Uncharacterized protein n=1 Tax=Caballeronia sordidicola TaxID=196367 RepID=A0A242MHV5_CABSO|nr:hypothetical protein PAMC26577_27235 [Caballeronia sordidicola]OTP80498.1 hypothetical protein PAMC26510_02535 [Caballeronia sordidicola]